MFKKCVPTVTLCQGGPSPCKDNTEFCKFNPKEEISSQFNSKENSGDNQYCLYSDFSNDYESCPAISDKEMLYKQCYPGGEKHNDATFDCLSRSDEDAEVTFAKRTVDIVNNTQYETLTICKSSSAVGLTCHNLNGQYENCYSFHNWCRDDSEKKITCKVCYNNKNIAEGTRGPF